MAKKAISSAKPNFLEVQPVLKDGEMYSMNRVGEKRIPCGRLQIILFSGVFLPSIQI